MIPRNPGNQTKCANILKVKLPINCFYLQRRACVKWIQTFRQFVTTGTPPVRSSLRTTKPDASGLKVLEAVLESV